MACNIKASPRLLEWTQAMNPRTVLLKTVQKTVADKSLDRSTYQQAVERAGQWYGELRSIDLKETVDKLVEKGIIRLDPNGIQGYSQVGAVNIQDAAAGLVSLKQILQGSAAGLEDLASVLIAKTEAGENAFDAARRFAHQAENAAVISSTILDYDKDFGQGLLLQQLQSNKSLREWMGKVGMSDADQKKEILKTSTEMLRGSRDLINSGDPQSIIEGIRGIKNYATLVKEMGSPEKIIDLNNHRPGVGQMLWHIAVNGLLSRPATFVVNASSATYAFARPAFQMLGAMPTAVTGVGPGGRKAAMEAVQIAAAELSGMTEALQSGFQLAWHTLVTGKAMYDVNTDWATIGTKFKEIENGGWNGANFAAMGLPIQPGDTMWAGLDMLGNILSVPGRGLLAADDLVKNSLWRGQMKAAGIRAALADGIDLSDKAAIAAKMQQQKELMFNFDRPGIDQWSIAEHFKNHARTQGEYLKMHQEVLTSTFQEETALSTNIYKVLQTPVIGPLLRPYLPFVKTPVNILKQGFIDSTGVGGLIKNGQLAISENGWNVFKYHDTIVKEAEKDPAAFYRYMGQVAFAGGLLATVHTMAMQGQISGGGPARWSMNQKDDEGKPISGAKAQMQAVWLNGRRAMGFTDVYQVKVGDAVIPISSFGEPFNTIAKMVIDIGEMSGYMDSREQDEGMAAIAGVVVSSLYQNSFLTGVKKLMDVVSDPDADGQKITKGAQDYVGVYTPFGGLLNYVETATDPYKKFVRPESPEQMSSEWENFWMGFTAPIRARIPGMGADIPDQYDPVYGRPVPTNPGVGNQTYADPAMLAVPFLPRGLAEADPLWERILQAAPAYRPYSANQKDLTKHEQMAMNRRSADFRIDGKTKAQALEELFSQPEVAATLGPLGTISRVDRVVQGMVMEIENKYGKAILAEMAGQNPSLLEREAVRKQLKFAGEKMDNGEELNQLTTRLGQLKALAARTQRGVPKPPEPMAIPAP
jgi:hypothetical protein